LYCNHLAAQYFTASRTWISPESSLGGTPAAIRERRDDDARLGPTEETQRAITMFPAVLARIARS
jgi:hypothetical protein